MESSTIRLMIQPAKRHARTWRGVITVGLIIGLIIILRLNATKFQSGLHVLQLASLPEVSVAASLLVMSFFIAGGIYQCLALHTLRYHQTVLIEMSASAVNRLLPAGLGGLGLHGVYLYKHKHSVAQATAVVSVNNLLGITAHLSLLAIVLIIWPNTLRVFRYHVSSSSTIWIVLGFIISIGLVSLLPVLRRKIMSFVRNLLISFQAYFHRPARLIVATLLAVCLTLTYTAILYVCVKALHVHISLVGCFIVFSLGMLVGTVTPTPGGLVGAEAGLYTGFIAYGFSPSNAIATALLFRLITYWLPIVPGTAALLVARNRQIV